MNFTKIRLSGRTDIDLPFFGLRPSNTYILKEVQGLGPPEMTVSNGKRIVQDRQIVVRAGLNPNYAEGQTVSAIRNTLYGLLTPGASESIVVKMMNGPNVVVQIIGYVSNFEIVPFTKDPEVQITIDCETGQPYLEAEEPVVLIPTTNASFTVDNIGTVTTGFYTEIIFNTTAASWSMFNQASGQDPRMRFVYAFLAGDKLMIDTRAGQRSIKLFRDPDTIDIIRALSATSVWFELHPGTNTLWTSPAASFDWGQIIYTPQYWGI